MMRQHLQLLVGRSNALPAEASLSHPLLHRTCTTPSAFVLVSSACTTVPSFTAVPTSAESVENSSRSMHLVVVVYVHLSLLYPGKLQVGQSADSMLSSTAGSCCSSSSWSRNISRTYDLCLGCLGLARAAAWTFGSIRIEPS